MKNTDFLDQIDKFTERYHKKNTAIQSVHIEYRPGYDKGVESYYLLHFNTRNNIILDNEYFDNVNQHLVYVYFQLIQNLEQLNCKFTLTLHIDPTGKPSDSIDVSAGLNFHKFYVPSKMSQKDALRVVSSQNKGAAGTSNKRINESIKRLSTIYEAFSSIEAKYHQASLAHIEFSGRTSLAQMIQNMTKADVNVPYRHEILNVSLRFFLKKPELHSMHTTVPISESGKVLYESANQTEKIKVMQD